MNVLEHIKTLLYDYDCVIIPGFGGLLINRHESRIMAYKNTIVPPSRTVAFNEQLKVNDGLLISHIASEENLTTKEASEIVKKYVSSLADEIEEEGVIILEGVGNFSFNEENKLVFEPDTKANFLEESYGLTEVPISQIENDDLDMKQPPRRPRPAVARPPVRRVPKPESAGGNTPPPQKENKKEKAGSGEDKPSNKKPVFILLPILLLVAAGMISYFGKDKQGNPYLSALIPSLKISEAPEKEPKVEEAPVVEASEPEEEVAVVDSVPETEVIEEEVISEPVAEAKPAKKKSVPGTITSSTGRFHIVAGSFRESANAENFKMTMQSKSDNVKMIAPGGNSGLYKISVAQYESLESALGDIDGLRATYGSEIWVYEE